MLLATEKNFANKFNKSKMYKRTALYLKEQTVEYKVELGQKYLLNKAKQQEKS
jgi:hypothetical protein